MTTIFGEKSSPRVWRSASLRVSGKPCVQLSMNMEVSLATCSFGPSRIYLHERGGQPLPDWVMTAHVVFSAGVEVYRGAWLHLLLRFLHERGGQPWHGRPLSTSAMSSPRAWRSTDRMIKRSRHPRIFSTSVEVSRLRCRTKRIRPRLLHAGGGQPMP